MTSPNLVPQSYCSYYYINPRAKHPCFCICRKRLALKACLIICHVQCGDKLHLTVSRCCASLPFFHADMFPPHTPHPTHRHVRTHTHTLTHTEVGRWRWAERSCHRAEWSATSKIDIRIYSEVDTNGFLSGEQEEDEGTEELEECRMWLLLE